MADSIKIKITGDASEFQSTLSRIAGTAGSMFKGIMASQIVTKGVSLLTGELKNAMTAGMQFEAAMSQVAAISGATGSELELLTETAKHYGETTMFSASQAAEALNYMALAGWDANQSVDALGGVLDLAAASGMDLGAASDAVTDYLSAFSMEASQAGYMADMMAYAQSRSNTTASMLADAYGNCASSMHAAGQDIETTTAMLMALANQGIKGSEAGTQMAAVMRDLTQKMDDGQIMIGKTAVKVTDAAGNFRDLNDIVMDVGKATEGMGTAEQSAAIMTTFTARSVKAIQTLLNEGMDNVNAYEDALRGSEGTAAEQARIMMDNLAGDIKIFESAVEGIRITASEGVNDSARDIVQEGTAIIEAMNQAGKAQGIGGMFDAAIAQIPRLLPKAVKGVEGLLSGVGKRLPGLVTNLISTIPDILGGMGELVPGLIDSFSGATAAVAEGLITRLPDIAGRVAGAIPGIMASALSGTSNVMVTALDSWYRLATGQVGKAFNLDQALENMLSEGRSGDKIVTLQAKVDAEIETSEAEAKIAEAIGSIQSAFSAEGLTIDSSEIVGMIHQSDEEIITACKALGMSDEGAQSVVEQVRALETSVNEAIAGLNLGDGLTEKVQQLTTSANTSKAELIASLKEMGLNPGEVAEVVAFWEQMNGELTAGVPDLFGNIAEALTDGMADTPDVVGQLHDQVQGWFDDAMADVDAWAELEISKLDPAEAGYDDAIADIQTKAGELKTELQGVKESADAWVDANANAATGAVKTHIGELEGIRGEAEALAQQIDAMTQDARAKMNNVGANAFRTVKIGGKVDAGTIDLAFTWVYNGHKEATAAIQEAHDEALRNLQAQNLDTETYNIEAGKIEAQFELDTQTADANYISQLRQMFAGLASSTLPTDAQESFTNALKTIDMLQPIKEWAMNSFEGEAPELPQEALQKMFPYTSPEFLDEAWQSVQQSGEYGQVTTGLNDWIMNTEREAAAALDAIDWSDLGTVLANAIDAGMFNGTAMDGLGGADLLGKLFGDSLSVSGADVTAITEPVGKGISDGVATGIESSAGTAVAASETMGREAAEAAGTGAGVHSPSSITTPVGQGIAEGVSTGITSGTGAAVAAGTALGSAAANAVKNGTGSVQAAGRNLSAGLASGILAGRGAVVAAARSVAQAAANAMRGALQIHSPSKVTEGFGRMFDQGFVTGINKDSVDVIRSAQSIANKLISTPNFRQHVDFDYSHAADLIGAVMNNGLSDVMDTEAARPIDLYINGRQMARATSRDYGTELNGFSKRISLGYGRG